MLGQKPTSDDASKPGGQGPAAGDAEPLAKDGDGEEEPGDDVEEAAPTHKSAGRGNGLSRQISSIERQLGRARRQNGFFISNWFTETPSTVTFPSASAIASSAPEDCRPLDAAIAEAYIRDSSRREGVSADLIREVVRKESGFNPCAVSPKGAMGMMQLTPATAASLGVDDPYDPRQNIDGGVRLMKRLLDKYRGRPDLALAAYNAGEAPVDAAQRVPDYQETQEYVSTIMKRVFEEPLQTGGRTSRAPAKVQPIPPIQSPPFAATGRE
ncbi:MAG: lytic transglycosylase domain-containing protein [Bryobacterales bacterium]|nr:lytic transglycosylase domain-containing protein [Bryobacterales bacterium]